MNAEKVYADLPSLPVLQLTMSLEEGVLLRALIANITPATNFLVELYTALKVLGEK